MPGGVVKRSRKPRPLFPEQIYQPAGAGSNACTRSATCPRARRASSTSGRRPGAARVRRSRALIRDPARLRFAVSRRGAAPRSWPWAPGCSRRVRLGTPRRISRSRRTTTCTCAPGTSSTTPRSNARFTTTSSGRRRTSSSRSASTAWTRTTARPSSASSPISRTNVTHPPGTPLRLWRGRPPRARPAPRRGRVPDRRARLPGGRAPRGIRARTRGDTPRPRRGRGGRTT